MSRRDTNPHFSRPPRPQHDVHQQPPIPIVPPRERRGQPPTQEGAPTQEEDLPYHPHFPLRPYREDRQQPPISQAPPREHLGRTPRGGARTPRGGPQVTFQEPPPTPHGSAGLPPPDHPPEPLQPHQEPRTHARHERHRGPMLPQPQKAQPYTWFGAVLCVIFWLVIIIGGLIVLIVYLVFRPQSPHFDVTSVTLNAAYLDLGSLLNADLTMLANFTNPNKKVHVDFSSVIIYLSYGSTLIATQYVDPFSAAKVESRFASIHMVTSQVQLPQRESQRLMKQMESNGVLLQVTGVFRARSKLGSILRYSYNLYGRCSIMVTRPPDGILLKKKCRTKR